MDLLRDDPKETPEVSETGADLIKRIQNTRRELLDLSARNRLISTPRSSSPGKKIEIADERSEEVFRLLVRERKSMSFLSGIEETDDRPAGEAGTPLLTQPDEPSIGDGTPDARHVDLRLQTRLGSERLQGRLLSIYYDAQTYEQEQGVSILYLAMGFLKWYESPSSDKARYAPLLLIPVDLKRQTAASRFHIEYREEDITTNLSLQAKLRSEFGIDLPEVPEMDELSPAAYFHSVAQAVANQPRWGVLRDDMVIWFFSFAKYLMYRDLDPATWPEHSPLASNRNLSSLLGDGFVAEPSLCDENDKIDPLIPPINMVHVTDADSSQTIAIEEVRLGRHLVIQGPPGTGKSQTITNLIATAVKAGKKVLFVAEKMAALEVVHSRLERLGLGSICLELHSSKANKKTVLDEIARTLALGRPKSQWSEERLETLKAAIDHLNNHALIMNTPIEPAGVTPYQVIGRLAHLYARGIEATTFSLPAPESWSGPKFREHCRALADLRQHLEELGSPHDNPWKGVSRTEPLLPTDMKDLRAGVADAISCLNGVAEAHTLLVNAFNDARPTTPSLREVQQVAQLALRLAKAPAMDRQAMGNPAWETRLEEIAGLVERGRAHSESVVQLEGTLREDAWQADLAKVRQSLSTHGRSVFRWFRRDYREAIGALRGLLQSELPRQLADRLKIIDEAIEARDVARALDHDPTVNQLGLAAFGAAWKGSKSDWNSLALVVKWDSDCRADRARWNHRGILARLDRPEALQGPLKTASATLKPASNRLHDLAKFLSLNVTDAFGIDKLNAVPIGELLARLKLWQEHPESLSKWIGYQMRRRRLEESGLGAIVAGIQDGQIVASAAVDQFQVAYYQTLIRDVFRKNRDLAEFDGRSHEQWIAEFRAHDQQRIEMARGEVATAHYDAIPRSAMGGEMAVLRREFEKRRKHKPIRQLIKEAGTAILAIKPVFMMSPISVAQFLEPGSVTFDLLLIDEASQVSPVDALGAMARAAQVVVVGDDKQLPPTRFFSKMLDDDESQNDGDGLNASDLESILGLCVAQGMSQRMLRWHYRSRHHSLIAVSNREFYDSRLFVVPSPTTITAMHGLHFRLVKDGTFDRGNSATNRVEARAVAEAVVDHARRFPRQSLGVGAFSVSQRDAIRDELEVLQREHPELAPFFATGRSEPFFVKNLENIQGDERDVIFISIGYARDKSGYMAMNFGPLSSDGGERRLNVLISRARERCEVFGSITADDIDLQRAKSRGAAAFKTFLRFAATGALDAPAPTGGDHGSDFERQVEIALEDLGHEVHRQVGTAGFIIDLAIVDPVKPGRYLLGIECDGATYHSSRSARDRDRLRETVLKDRGWKIHRVWSTDWFHRPGEQLQKIVAAIDKARIDWDCDEQAAYDHDDAPEDLDVAPGDIERNKEPDGINGEPHFAWACTYVESNQEVPSSTPIPETRLSILEGVVTTLVQIEGPIHKDEIARRITSLWGLQRTGPRIAEAIASAVEAGIRSGKLCAELDFITHRQQSIVPVRDRSGVTASNLKKPEMIPPSEVRQAILHFVKEQIGLRREELPAMVSRVLGFKTTSAKVKELVEKTLASMHEAGVIVSRDDKLFLA
jgi:very-short-patch-repair endonuclease